MDNLKIAKVLFKLQMDDLKDADMLADYAREMIDCGDENLAHDMVTRAKERLNHSADCDSMIKTVMQRMRMENADVTVDEDGIYSVMYKDYIHTWSDKIRLKLENI